MGQIYPSVTTVEVSQVLVDEWDMEVALLKTLANVIEKNVCEELHSHVI